MYCVIACSDVANKAEIIHMEKSEAYTLDVKKSNFRQMAFQSISLSRIVNTEYFTIFSDDEINFLDYVIVSLLDVYVIYILTKIMMFLIKGTFSEQP